MLLLDEINYLVGLTIHNIQMVNELEETYRGYFQVYKIRKENRDKKM
jgi:hypothetical protein